MHVTHRLIAFTAACGLAIGGQTALAQEAEIEAEVAPPSAEVDVDAQPPVATTPQDAERQDRVVVVRQEAPAVRADVDIDDGDDFYEDSFVFLEAAGATGFQLGDTEYLPSGTPGDWQFPVVYGFGVGGTAGVMVSDTVAIIVSYQYQRAQTRDGNLEGVLDNVEGRIDYHTTVAGVRVYVPTGFGAVRAELAVGVVFPHSTELQLDYGPGLALLPQPITGTGFRTSNFSVGYGGQARLGYEIPIVGPLYAALDVQLQVFQAENSGETTELRNFVVDFEATPPTAVNTTLLHGDGALRPETRGVGSGLAVLSLGVRI